MTAAESAAAGITQITVQTPAPGGGVSNVLQFELDSGGGAPAAFGTATATVTAGETATYAVTLPSGTTNVSLRCLNLPSGASCNYTTNPSAMTIVTSASTSPGVYQVTAIFTETLPGTATALAFAPFLLLPLAVAGKKCRKQYVWPLGLMLTILALAISSCGGGGGSVPVTPPTHQATSSGVVTLTVH